MASEKRGTKSHEKKQIFTLEKTEEKNDLEGSE